jgi:hypothetical protein
MSPKARVRSIYSPHPSIAYAQSMLANMRGKTGRSLEQWLTFLRKNGPGGEVERREWLKEEHGVGTYYAAWIAALSVGKGEEDTDPEKYLACAARYVEEMFSGPKAALLPIYERLLAAAFALGSDVKVSPCKTIVPIFRNFAIAQVKPATRTRVDFGLALGKYPGKLPARLVDTGGAAKKDRITHKLELTAPEKVDAGLAKWLRAAYELDEK